MKWFKRAKKEIGEKTAPDTVEASRPTAVPTAKPAQLVTQLEGIDAGLDPFRFQQMCNQIGEARDAGAAPLLIDLLGRRGREGLAPDNRSAAIQALGQIGDPAAVEILVDELEISPAYAAAALGRIGERRATEPLISVLQHDSWSARSAAAEALGRLGDPNAIDALREMENDPRPEVQRAAEAALAKLEKGGITWYLDTTDTQQVGNHLIALGIVERATVARMFSLGTYRLLSSAGSGEKSPGTVTLGNTQFGDGVCGDPFVVDRIVLNLGAPGQRDVASITCPSCGAFFELSGVTCDDGQSEPETWLVTNLVSIPDRFAQSPYLGWPQIDRTTVDVDPAEASKSGEIGDWEVVEAGVERNELIEAGDLSADTIEQFSVYRIRPPAGVTLQRDDTVAVSGVEVCGVCRYEIPLDTVIGIKGFFDYPSKQVIACPRCNASALIVGLTTTSGATRHWLLATQESGAPGVHVSEHGGRPELRLGKVERATNG